jgi:predicted methyltransferase
MEVEQMGEAKQKAEAAAASAASAKTMTIDQVRPIYDASFRASRTTISVIDAMSQRGAIKGEEMSAIGQLRDQCVQIAQMCEQFHSEND